MIDFKFIWRQIERESELGVLGGGGDGGRGSCGTYHITASPPRGVLAQGGRVVNGRRLGVGRQAVAAVATRLGYHLS